MKMQFFFLGNDYRSNPPVDSFKAVKMKNKSTGKIEFHPIPEDNIAGGEVFIYGDGWKTYKPQNVVDIPVFSKDSSDWNSYLEKYGEECLFYSLDGTDRNSGDCTSMNRQTEFISIMRYGANGYAKFMEKYMKMWNLQKKVIYEKYVPVLFERYPFDMKDREKYIEETVEKRYLFHPMFYFEYSWLYMKYAPHVTNDDSKMYDLYRDYRERILKNESETYQEALRLEKKKFEIYDKIKSLGGFYSYDVPEELKKEYYRLDKECYDLFRKHDEVEFEILMKELTEENDVFPSGIRDRMEYLFGKEVADLYSEMVDESVKEEELVAKKEPTAKKEEMVEVVPLF